MPTVVFSFLTPANIRSSEIAKSFFESVNTDLNGASLGKYGEVEPLSRDFANDLDGACKLWEQNLFWSETQRKGSGAVLHGTSRRHTNLSFYFDTPAPDGPAWIKFLTSVSHLLAVDYSSVHFFDKKSRTEEDEVLEGITSHDIQESLPTIAWAGCFGKPYVELIGKDDFESSGFVVVEPITESLIFCQLTSDPLDYIDNYETFRSRQDSVKSILGKDYFLGAPNATVPDFQFEHEVA
ncbi:hypothetical protein Pla8534_59080 [Lignipirellula cremea]|uniref:Uncharacterized protein n=2 Tax=Lignipirellula cremea TaxID=2528010 RepID=A0A518E1S0_9BACT|nr:hypothetical protein Pla8534_59080 [Lignipirellula cremea]